jgi:hypothetical protein
LTGGENLFKDFHFQAVFCVCLLVFLLLQMFVVSKMKTVDQCPRSEIDYFVVGFVVTTVDVRGTMLVVGFVVITFVVVVITEIEMRHFLL